MAIIQISKIQQRSGDLVDLPQLDEAEFGFASDEKRLFIGKENPNENIEVLTSYSEIAFSQIEGSNANIFITDATLANGQIMAYDGSEWVNKGGNAGGLITLGDVSNVKMDGGAISYVLTTDGVGNLSWTPKGTVELEILNISNASPALVTLTANFSLTNNTEVTINGIVGNTGFTALNGNTFFLQSVPGYLDQYTLYETTGTGSPFDASALSPLYPYTTATATNTSTDAITVANSVPFANTNPVLFYGDLANSGLVANTIYYICDVPNTTSIVVCTSSDGNIANKVNLTTDTISANVHTVGGKVISTVSGGTSSGGAAGGVTSSIQYNFAGVIVGDSDFTWANSSQLLSVNGNANIGNVSIATAGGIGTITANRLVSNIVTGTAPLTVTSTTRVANLNVAYSNVTDFINITTTTTGTFYPVLTNSLTGNVSEFANANLVFNAATGNLSATLLTGTLTTAAQPNITSVGTLTSLAITGNVTAGNVYANSGTVGAANVNVSGNVTAANLTANTGIISGNGSGISAINASNISSGTLAQARLANSTFTLNGTLITLGGTSSITATATNPLTLGTYLTGGSYNGSGPITTSVDATSANTPNKVVARDANGSFSANIITATQFNGDLSGYIITASQPNITSVGTLTSLTVSGNVSAGGVKTDNYYYANGVAISFAGTYSNSNVAAYLPTYNGNVGGGTAQFYGNRLTTGAAANPGTITGNWTLTSGSRMEATYADLAEYYAADKAYIPGTVLEFGGEQEVTVAGIESNKLAGVVSSEPAYVMNGNIQAEHPTMIALIGRVPVRVTGKINKGDMLVSAGNGLAKAAITMPKVGTVIGKAITNKGTDGEGVVEVLVGRM